MFYSYVIWPTLNTRNRVGCQRLDVRIPVYFLVAVFAFLLLHEHNSYFLFTLCFLCILDIVYNSSKFMFLCSRHCFGFPPDISSKFSMEFILIMLHVDGLLSFLIYHQTLTYWPRPKCYLALEEIICVDCSAFLENRDSMSNISYVFSTTNLRKPILRQYNMAFLCICERPLFGNLEDNSLSWSGSVVTLGSTFPQPWAWL